MCVLSRLELDNRKQYFYSVACLKQTNYKSPVTNLYLLGVKKCFVLRVPVITWAKFNRIDWNFTNMWLAMWLIAGIENCGNQLGTFQLGDLCQNILFEWHITCMTNVIWLLFHLFQTDVFLFAFFEVKAFEFCDHSFSLNNF